MSASVPDASQGDDYVRTADVPAIQSAVIALISVVLGRVRLVCGGHPSITPLILLAARTRGIPYDRWVTLYQSRYYEEIFPEENREFNNMILTPNIGSDPARSQEFMRAQMLKENHFRAAVFIGGMSGVEEEFNMFLRLPYRVNLLPMASTGGAARSMFRVHEGHPRLRDELTYETMFRDLLDLPE